MAMAGGMTGGSGDELAYYKTIDAAKALLPRLEATIRHSGQFDAVYATRSRVKNPATLKNKIETKRQEGRPDYGLDNVSDIIGMRFISLYRRDVTATIAAVLDLIAGQGQVSPNALNGMTLLELKSYTSNSIAEQDPVNIELKSIFEPGHAARTNVVLEMIPRSRYSSVHVVLKAPFDHDGARYHIAIEMQFRSAFEDAWAEIDHKLLYELGRFNQKVDEDRREAIEQHMTILKKMVDTAADYADVIRRTVIDPNDRPVSIPRNLDGADYIRELGARAGIDRTTCDQLAGVLAEKATLDTQIERNRPGASIRQYIGIAAKLAAINATLRPDDATGDPSAMRTILFSARMEEALCRLLSNEEDELLIALELYRSITGDFPDFPIGWFRSAQAHQRLSDINPPLSDIAHIATATAFEHYARADAALKACASIPATERILLISPVQAEYIATNAARLQGFTRWRLSDRRRYAGEPASSTDLDDVLTAFTLTHAAFRDERDRKERVKLANNTAFYAAEALTIANALSLAPDTLPTRQQLIDLLKVLDGRTEPRDNILRLDTIARAYLAIDREDKAIEAATAILDLNERDDSVTPGQTRSAYMSEVTTRALKNAWRIVKRNRDRRDDG